MNDDDLVQVPFHILKEFALIADSICDLEQNENRPDNFPVMAWDDSKLNLGTLRKCREIYKGLTGYKFYTVEELKRWWPARCPECHWRGLSRDAAGGGSIADTGDYDDVVCPKCYTSVEDDNNAGCAFPEDVT